MALLPRLIVAYFLGVTIGTLVFLPMMGVMIVAILPASIIIGLPFLGIGIAVLLTAPNWVRQNLGFATSISALATFIIWYFYDTPHEPAGWQRLALCSACAVIASMIFYGWNKLRPAY
jgi:hypothetical protein